MKTPEFLSPNQPASGLVRAKRRTVAVLAAAVLGICLVLPDAIASDDGIDDDDAEVLTRGPVHEAFASVVDYNPSRGFVAPRTPPDPIPEIPPDERPDGDNVVWIPGYWAWDDESSDFIWVSGVWRDPPPGREWVSGYWTEDSGDWLWISGYWADVETSQTTYLPAPPKSLESGPNTDAPSDEYTWVPGCWIWYHDDYAWRPGYWARCRPDWVWIPAHYVWSRRGYVFIEGYWDYTATRRGVVYAPVRFHTRIYSRRGWHYSPRVCFNLGLFLDYLFLRPSCNHYYFGDYYAPRYEREGFFVTFSFYYGWHGYEPFYAHRRWEHRRDRDWERQFQEAYRYRRENDTARPPDTWSAQVRIAASTSTQDRIVVAGTATQFASTTSYPVKFRKVDGSERKRFTERAREVDALREKRREIEVASVAANRTDRRAITRPEKVERPRSPIVARSVKSYRGSDAPPKAEKTPRPFSREAASSRSPTAPGQDKNQGAADVRGKSATEARPRPDVPDKERSKPGPGRVDREKGNAASAADRRAQEAEARRARQAEARAKKDAQSNADREAAQRAQAEKQARVKQASEKKARAQEAAKQKALEAQRQREQKESDRRAQQAEAKAREDARAKAAKEADDRERAEKARAAEEARSRALQVQQQKRQEAAERRAAQERAEAGQAGSKGATNGREKKTGQQRSSKSGKANSNKDDEDDPNPPGNGRGHD